MVPQIRLVMVREPGPEALTIRVPDDVAKFVEPLKYSAEEQFVSLHLNALNQVTGFHVVSHGTLTDR
jgi:DNA repair protein RadC